MTGEDVHLLLGAYVLGGLSDADRASFEAHLHGCDRCSHELATSAGIPALLRRVDGALAETPRTPRPDPAALLTRHHQRRHRRVAWIAAAAAALVAAIAVSITALGAGSAPTDARFTALGPTPVTGDADFEAKPWGTAIQLDLSALPALGTFALEVRGRDGTLERAATWSGTDQARTRVSAATSIPTVDIVELQVVRATPGSAPGVAVAIATPTG